MCGINGMLSRHRMTDAQRTLFYRSSRKIAHRGPDRSTISILNDTDVMLSFERLSIMDLSSNGDQPFKYETEDGHTIYCMCNGEIYHYRDICKEHDFHPVSESDCEVIPLLYRKFGLEHMSEITASLNSEHAFAILDIDHSTGDYKLILSSDRYGIRPLFVGSDESGFYFSSELQGLPCLRTAGAFVQRFPPRHYAVIEKRSGVLSSMILHRYHEILPKHIVHYDQEECMKGIRELLNGAVISRLESDRPYGCLLSGGLDSSLVASLAARHLRKFGKKLRTFSVGMPGSTDAPFAKLVAEFIGSKHTHVELSDADFLSAVPHIVRTTGSYDITTVRASTGQYLISKWISENTDIKVLLCGDGADEYQSGYMYFHNAPSAVAAHLENVRLLDDIHQFDGLRADRCISHWGLEARFPMLDHLLVEFYLRCDPELRVPGKSGGGRIEKWLMRESFRTENVLPTEVLSRKKEGFSDAVSSVKKSWYVTIQEQVEKLYSDTDVLEAASKFIHLPPISKESLYYRNMFCEYFGENESVAQTIPYFWLPKWCGDIKEPSARVLDVY